MLIGLMMVWLVPMLLGAMVARWFEEQRINDTLGRDGTKSLIIIDVAVEGAACLPRGLLDEAVLPHAESIPNPRAHARCRSARGPPPGVVHERVQTRGTTTD
jgi:hypothetical protein